ncbi:MAG: hypothetical protein K2Q06_02410, partial [Parvularculaceae bacterium]|nr:hypothetical protein [Parvularculaceae bacterium]
RRSSALVEGPIIDCSGHKPDASAPIIRSLFAAGLARADDLGLGVMVGADGAALGGGARAVYAIGPVGAGALGEITATPEIVAQAAAAARGIAAHLEKMSS